jgi:small subunit ribosomal protein S2
MKPYIYGQRITKDGYKMNILDLGKIINSCQEVGSYIQSLIDKKKTILFLITRKSTRDIVKEAAVRCGMPYIVNK